MKDDHMRIPRERKVIMGYFDDAKASREEENTLEHSSGAWKKHKYIQKIGTGAKAVYKYSKKAGGKVVDAIKNPDKSITGSYYKDQADMENMKSEVESSWVNSKSVTPEMSNRYAKNAERHGRKAAEAESAYYTKSLAGKSKATVERGKALIKDFFTPKTKVTVSSNLTGTKTIKPKPAEKVTLKKNKLSFKKN